MANNNDLDYGRSMTSGQTVKTAREVRLELLLREVVPYLDRNFPQLHARVEAELKSLSAS